MAESDRYQVLQKPHQPNDPYRTRRRFPAVRLGTQKPRCGGRRVSSFQLGTEVIQAPMAGHSTSRLTVEVSRAGGLGILALGGLSPDQASLTYREAQSQSLRALGCNFFCFEAQEPTPEDWEIACKALAEDYSRLGLSLPTLPSISAGFTDGHCAMVEELRPQFASFHFGFPTSNQVERLKRVGTKILSTANSVEDAADLRERGADAIIAQGYEAGGHRNSNPDLSAPRLPTLDLVRDLRDRFSLPLIAAGGIGTREGVRAALQAGAQAAQVGSAYLMTHEAKVTPLHAQALQSTRATRLTRSLSGAWARVFDCEGAQRIPPVRLPFPLGLALIGPLRAQLEATGSDAFSPQYCGQGPRPKTRIGAAQLTRQLLGEA
jgi:nitronate monooxygenase